MAFVFECLCGYPISVLRLSLELPNLCRLFKEENVDMVPFCWLFSCCISLKHWYYTWSCLIFVSCHFRQIPSLCLTCFIIFNSTFPSLPLPKYRCIYGAAFFPSLAIGPPFFSSGYEWLIISFCQPLTLLFKSILSITIKKCITIF